MSPEFDQALARLRDANQPVPMTSLYHLSDLGRDDLAALEAAWDDIPGDRRLAIIQNLSEIGEANFEVNFEPVLRLALDDDSPEVRAMAVRGLWESEDPTLAPRLLEFLVGDNDARVRAAAASGLGRFVYLGEMEELPAPQLRRIEDALLNVIGGLDDLEVRRRALEAVAYSSRAEVPPLIAEAYDSDEVQMRTSAIFAMGRTADERWAESVRAELDSEHAELRFEAARAAGELELSDAARQLAELIDDEDSQVREAAIWSLGQVGGTVAREALNALLHDTTDEDDQEFIQEALENLDFTDEMQEFALLDFDEADLDGFVAEDDDEGEDDEDDGAEDGADEDDD